jgi:hypothetical protein
MKEMKRGIERVGMKGAKRMERVGMRNGAIFLFYSGEYFYIREYVKVGKQEFLFRK